MKILAQCIAGLQDVVANMLQSQKIADKILKKEDGMLIFKTSATFNDISHIGYINNSFLVIDEAPQEIKGINDFLVYLSHYPVNRWKKQFSTLKARHFRISLSDENQLVSGDTKELKALANTLSRATGLSWLPRGGDKEFWIMRRRNGDMYFCMRLSRRGRTEKYLRKGELRPELTRILCFLSEPKATDIFLDPFSGSGAIGFARAQQPYNMMFLSDIDEANTKAMKAAVKAGRVVRERKGSPLIIRTSDARTLEKINDNFVDKVVTDPPWGFYDTDITDLPRFYREAMQELCRVTKHGGIIICLLGQRDMIDGLTRGFSAQLRQEARFDILVSGKKASIVKWLRL